MSKLVTTFLYIHCKLLLLALSLSHIRSELHNDDPEQAILLKVKTYWQNPPSINHWAPSVNSSFIPIVAGLKSPASTTLSLAYPSKTSPSPNQSHHSFATSRTLKSLISTTTISQVNFQNLFIIVPNLSTWTSPKTILLAQSLMTLTA